jgi:hypothetical protein
MYLSIRDFLERLKHLLRCILVLRLIHHKANELLKRNNVAATASLAEPCVHFFFVVHET